MSASTDLTNEVWSQSTLISIDLETSGKYPLESQICEMAAIKWRSGNVVAKYQTLVKPSLTMSDEVIAIHNITNEMVKDAPAISEVIQEFYEFISDGIIVGHHSPFDVGFLAIDLEEAQLKLPETPVLCSSILSRRAYPEAPNHKLKTLVDHLSLETTHSHRAYDDANSCLALTLKLLDEVVGADKTWSEVVSYQNDPIYWQDYSMQALVQNPVYRTIVNAVKAQQEVQITYQGGSRKGQARTVTPIGVVRRGHGQDFLVAIEDGDTQSKRYFFNKITAAAL